MGLIMRSDECCMRSSGSVPSFDGKGGVKALSGNTFTQTLAC